MKKIKPPPSGWLALVVAVLLAIAGAYGITTTHGDSPATPDTPTPSTGAVTLPSPTGATSQVIDPDSDHQITAADEKAAAHDPTIASHEDQVDEQPAGAPAAAAAKVATAAAAVPTYPQPVGGAQGYSCPNKFVVNYSSNAPGVPKIQFVVHETVSNISSFWIIWRLFNTPSFGASSDYLMSVDGFCRRLVPPGKKAWTQGAFNSASKSVEIVAPSGQSRSWWLKQPIIKRGILAGLIRDNLKSMGVPLRWVDPVGCTPKGGWTDHEHLECGNDHCDVTGCDNFPWEVVQAQVVAGVSSPIVVSYPNVPNFGRKRRAWCDRLALVRKHAKDQGWTERRVAAATHYKQLIGKGSTTKCKFVT